MLVTDPFEKTKSLLGSKNIQSISVSLTDNKNNELDLNGVPYTITLKLEIIDNTTHDLNFTNYATDARKNTPVEKNKPRIYYGKPANHKWSHGEPLSEKLLIEYNAIKKMIKESNKSSKGIANVYKKNGKTKKEGE